MRMLRASSSRNGSFLVRGARWFSGPVGWHISKIRSSAFTLRKRLYTGLGLRDGFGDFYSCTSGWQRQDEIGLVSMLDAKRVVQQIRLGESGEKTACHPNFACFSGSTLTSGRHTDIVGAQLVAELGGRISIKRFHPIHGQLTPCAVRGRRGLPIWRGSRHRVGRTTARGHPVPRLSAIVPPTDALQLPRPDPQEARVLRRSVERRHRRERLRRRTSVTCTRVVVFGRVDHGFEILPRIGACFSCLLADIGGFGPGFG